jgi:glycosyltransferase involved in cell wall biosynthesis
LFDLAQFREEEFRRREANLIGAQRQKLRDKGPKRGRLHAVYVMTHTGVCGGTKIILEHANHLVRHGHQVTLVSHFDKPDWFPMDHEVGYVQVPFTTELTFGIPACDVIVATYWREIYECILRNIAPVVYFEQGDYHLFDWESVNEREKQYIYTQFQTVPFLFTVSPGAAEQIKEVFHREATVIPNAIDERIFYPGASGETPSQRLRISMIGSLQNDFKRIDDIKDAVRILEDKGYIVELKWVSPDMPSEPMGTVEVNPPQATIGEVLRNTDYFVCASTYESFSLPVLEAMACGCAVLTTKNKGVLSYALEGENCIWVEMQNPTDIADKIEMLHEDRTLRERIVRGGLTTAGRFTWSAIVPQLLGYYRELARYAPDTV